jgi:hypothetical protein
VRCVDEGEREGEKDSRLHAKKEAVDWGGKRERVDDEEVGKETRSFDAVICSRAL